MALSTFTCTHTPRLLLPNLASHLQVLLPLIHLCSYFQISISKTSLWLCCYPAIAFQNPMKSKLLNQRFKDLYHLASSYFSNFTTSLYSTQIKNTLKMSLNFLSDPSQYSREGLFKTPPTTCSYCHFKGLIHDVRAIHHWLAWSIPWTLAL